MKSKFCLACNKEIIRKPNDHNSHWEKRKFCSSKCCNSRPNKGQFKKGHPGYLNVTSFSVGNKPWNKGGSHLKVRGEKNPGWKGDGVGYYALHTWVSRWLGKPCECSSCGGTFSGRSIHWANKSGKYKRDLEDWLRLCAKCHRSYDLKNNLINVWQK